MIRAVFAVVFAVVGGFIVGYHHRENVEAVQALEQSLRDLQDAIHFYATGERDGAGGERR